ncbi:MAG: ribosome biogenesis GTPase YlqF [Cyanobacteria bacterium J06623_7]
MSAPPIQWYPGHIAKAERQLKEQLTKVDVVLEILDARIPLASHHPQIDSWIGTKPRITVLNREDMISEGAKQAWRQWFAAQEIQPYFTNAKQSKGIKPIKNAAQKAGVAMNQRRRDRGMRPRPVRAVVIGFPNVGKSALINRLVGKKIVVSERRAGVTRQLRWVKISKEIELLDAPGIIPWRLENQHDAVKLAICEDIGQASYDNQVVAAQEIDLLIKLGHEKVLKSRFNFDFDADIITGEAFIQEVSDRSFKGDKERVARQILYDFRTGNMGKIALELPPSV